MTEKENQNCYYRSLEIVKSEALDESKSHRHRLCGSIRLFIAVLTFWGMCMMSAMRISTSMAIVCMINRTAIIRSSTKFNTSSKISSKCQFTFSENYSETEIFSNNVREGEFAWSKEIQGHIHASIFWGYLITQLPGALIGHKFGGRVTAGCSLLLSAVATALCPIAARLHFILLILLRFVTGMLIGTTVSQKYKIFSKWSSPNERSILLGISMSGINFGSAAALGISSLFCQFEAWEWIFYLFAAITFIWFLIWMIVVSDEPSQNRFVTKNELFYLNQTNITNKKVVAIPWSDILKSKRVWSIIAAHVFNNWIVYSFETNLPTFLNDQLGLSQYWNGLTSFTTYIIYGSGVILWGIAADVLITSKIFSVTAVRKMFTTLGMFVPSLLALILAIMPLYCDYVMLHILLAGCIIVSVGCSSSGYLVNMADLAPNFSAIIFSMSNSLGTIPGFLSPTFIGYITRNNLHSEWSIVFYVAAGINILGWIIFMLWGSGELQPWAIKKSELTIKVDDDDEIQT